METKQQWHRLMQQNWGTSKWIRTNSAGKYVRKGKPQLWFLGMRSGHVLWKTIQRIRKKEQSMVLPSDWLRNSTLHLSKESKMIFWKDILDSSSRGKNAWLACSQQAISMVPKVLQEWILRAGRCQVRLPAHTPTRVQPTKTQQPCSQ